jgi:plasmid stability protein
MANLTISLDDELLRAGRAYAEKHNTSLNALIRTILERTVTEQSDAWLEEVLDLFDQQRTRSKGKAWSRKDLYGGRLARFS